MRKEFSPQDIFHIAVQVENNGVDLYRALEEKSQSKDSKKVWAYLKEQEQRHAKLFGEMLENIGDYVVYDMGQGKYDEYFKVIASEYIITQKLTEKKEIKEFSSDIEAVDFGIYIEKESILTYSALKDYMQPGKQQQIDKIIDEEKRHLIELSSLKGSLKKTS